MPKDTKTLGNNKARACESLGFVHKKRLCQRFDTTSFFISGIGTESIASSNFRFLSENLFHAKVYENILVPTKL